MSEAAVIELAGVGKRFRRYDVNRAPTLKRYVMSGFRRQHAEMLWALRDVSATIDDGTTVGLIGQNGAGKSTLLRLIAGIGRPTEGRIDVHGRVGALLDLGKDFQPELSGRENAVASGVIAGLDRRQINALLPEIVEFAGLESFIDNPLRTYSSGMQARLAFGIAVHVRPDVLLIDEVLSVGDVAFQQRCLEKLREFQRQGMTIVLVSHDADLVRYLCTEVIWLRHGAVEARGPADEIEALYKQTMSNETIEITPVDLPEKVTPSGTVLRGHDNRFGSQEATVLSVRVLDALGAPCSEVSSGGGVQVEVRPNVPSHVGAAQLAVRLRREDDVICVDTSTPVSANDGGESSVTVSFQRLDLAPGTYAFDVGLYDTTWERTYDLHIGAYPLVVTGAERTKGLLMPPVVWKRDAS